MKIEIKRIGKNLPLPKFETKGSLAFDIYSRVDLEINPQEIVQIPTNLIIRVPKNYGLFLFSRSSIPKKLGLLIPHGVGIIDRDYSGESDEIKTQFYNFTDKIVKIEKGQRIAQAIILKIPKIEIIEVEKMSEVSRGGFGSTN